jgi:Sec-independent protein translocase protein TatA
MKKVQLFMFLHALMFATATFSVAVGESAGSSSAGSVASVSAFNDKLKQSQSLLPAVASAIKEFKKSFREAKKVLKDLPEADKASSKKSLEAVRNEFKLAIRPAKNKKSGKGKGDVSESEDDSDDTDA